MAHMGILGVPIVQFRGVSLTGSQMVCATESEETCSSCPNITNVTIVCERTRLAVPPGVMAQNLALGFRV